MLRKREQVKTQENDLHETEKSDLPDKEFQIMAIKMVTELGRMGEQSESFNKEKI